MISRRFLLIALLIGGLLAACGVQPVVPTATPSSGVPMSVEDGTYTNITPAQLAEMLNASRKDIMFINTHIPYEGEIAQTDAFIPFEKNGPQRVNEYPADKNAKIV